MVNDDSGPDGTVVGTIADWLAGALDPDPDLYVEYDPDEDEIDVRRRTRAPGVVFHTGLKVVGTELQGRALFDRAFLFDRVYSDVKAVFREEPFDLNDPGVFDEILECMDELGWKVRRPGVASE